MANNQTHQPNIELVRDLLSPYLDDEVTEEERALVEQALAASGELQQDLETLRQTVSLLADLPSVPAPRPFTLSEADVTTAAPAPRRFFGIPAWLGGLAAVAASLLCVLAVGGLFLMQQSGGLMSAPVELARYDESTAPQAAVSQAESSEIAEEPAAEAEMALEQPVEEQAAAPAEPPAPATEEKMALAEEPALEEEPLSTEPTAKEESTALEMEDLAADEETEEMVSVAGEAAEVEEEGQAEPDSGTFRGDESDTDTVAGGAMAATPAPMATTMALVAPTATQAVAEKAMPAEEAPGEESPAPAREDESQLEMAESAPAPPLAAAEAQEGNAAQRDMAARPARRLEIQNQTLSITPGLIQLAGFIEATPGTVLQATLQRNGEPFDSWAEPATLQTVVQADGQFAFDLRAQADRVDRDLFSTDPASYQIIISSVGTEEPVVAFVDFDTYGPDATAEPRPTATFTPLPSPTIVAKLTFVPSPEPSPTLTPTLIMPPEAAPQTVPPARTTIIIVAGIIVLGGLLLIGVIAWLLLRKQQR